MECFYWPLLYFVWSLLTVGKCIKLTFSHNTYQDAKIDVVVCVPSLKFERQIQWLSKVAERDSQGHSQPEMASILQVDIGTVNGDLSYLRQQAKSNISIDQRVLFNEAEIC